MSEGGRLVSVAPGRRLHVTEHGSGAPVLLLHGFSQGSPSMAVVAGELRAGRRVLAVDLLGHGRSDAPEDPAAYRMETCAADLAALLSALGAVPADVVGYSMGARAALALAVWEPRAVRSLVLVGGRAGIADPAERRARICADEALAEHILERGIDWFVEHWMALPLFASQRRLAPAVLAAGRRERRSQRPLGLAGSLRGMGAGAQPPLFDRLPGVAAPVLLVTGSEDTRFAALADDLARRLSRARRCVIPEAGHAAHLENPGAFGEALRRFLREVDARTARAEAPAAPALEETA